MLGYNVAVLMLIVELQRPTWI